MTSRSMSGFPNGLPKADRRSPPQLSRSMVESQCLLLGYRERFSNDLNGARGRRSVFDPVPDLSLLGQGFSARIGLVMLVALFLTLAVLLNLKEHAGFELDIVVVQVIVGADFLFALAVGIFWYSRTGYETSRSQSSDLMPILATGPKAANWTTDPVAQSGNDRCLLYQPYFGTRWPSGRKLCPFGLAGSGRWGRAGISIAMWDERVRYLSAWLVESTWSSCSAFGKPMSSFNHVPTHGSF